MMISHLISVIVYADAQPDRLNKCFQSIERQKYNNLEILIVPGTKGSGKDQAIREFQERDQRVKVLPRNTEGACEAYYQGAREASGAFLGFVNGNDYLAPEMYSYMMRKFRNHRAGVLACRFYDVRESGITSVCSGEDVVFNRVQATRDLINTGEMTYSLNNKLIRKKLFDAVYAEPAAEHDEKAAMHKIFSAAARIAKLGDPKYYRVIDAKQEKMAAAFPAAVNQILSNMARFTALRKNYPGLRIKMFQDILDSLKGFPAKCVIRNQEEYEQYKDSLLEIAAFIKSHRVGFRRARRNAVDERVVVNVLNKINEVLSKDYSIDEEAEMNSRQAAITVTDVDINYKWFEKQSFKSLFSKDRKKNQRVEAVKQASFEVKEGAILGIIGKNGSGKSTILKALAGIFAPDSGTIDLHGHSCSLLAIGIGFQNALTGRQNIVLSGMLLGFSEEFVKNKMDEIIEFSELGHFIDMPVKTYSSGMHSKLAFSIGAILETDILLIDEVLSVGDQRFRKKSFNKMKELINDENRTVVIVSHSIETLRSLCTHVMWMHEGKVVKVGKPDEVLDEYETFMNAD